MAARKHPPATERWIAGLVKEHGQNEALRQAAAHGVKVSVHTARRCFAEHYPGQSGARLDSATNDVANESGEHPNPSKPHANVQKQPHQVITPPKPTPDHEMVSAVDGDPETLLTLGLKRAVSLIGQGTIRENLQVLTTMDALIQRLERLRTDRLKRESDRRRLGILILPPEAP